MLDDDSTAKGYVLAVCTACTCPDCETPLSEGLCVFGCALGKRFSTSGAWVTAGNYCHDRAVMAATIVERNVARRLRAFCDRKALQLKLLEQKRASFLAAFEHVFAEVA